MTDDGTVAPHAFCIIQGLVRASDQFFERIRAGLDFSDTGAYGGCCSSRGGMDAFLRNCPTNAFCDNRGTLGSALRHQDYELLAAIAGENVG